MIFTETDHTCLDSMPICTVLRERGLGDFFLLVHFFDRVISFFYDHCHCLAVGDRIILILHHIVPQVTDYYTRALEYNNTKGELKSAHDLHEDTMPSFDGQGEFSTDLYTRKVDQSIDEMCSYL